MEARASAGRDYASVRGGRQSKGRVMHLLGVVVLPDLETLDQRAKTVVGVERGALGGSGGVSLDCTKGKEAAVDTNLV